jgi:hypothetical protein
MPAANGVRGKSVCAIYPSRPSIAGSQKLCSIITRVIEKIRADVQAGELTLQDIESFNDQPIARGVGDTATDATKTMWPSRWQAPRNR